MKCPNCCIELALQDDGDGRLAYKCPKCIFIAHPNHLKIDAMWAFVSVDQDGNEGVCAFQSGMGPMPMVAADGARVDSLRPIARSLTRSGLTIKLVKFSKREDLELFKGE